MRYNVLKFTLRQNYRNIITVGVDCDLQIMLGSVFSGKYCVERKYKEGNKFLPPILQRIFLLKNKDFIYKNLVNNYSSIMKFCKIIIFVNHYLFRYSTNLQEISYCRKNRISSVKMCLFLC